MKWLKKYYEDVCRKRQQELKKFWLEERKTSYRWQDIVKEALEINKKM
ncbi:hypothetical protein [Aminipila sp.]|nr:hypothetical protein [Aminipila sp.]